MRALKLTLVALSLLCTSFSYAQGGFTLSGQDQKPDPKAAKGQPTAKTQEEFKDYQAAMQLPDGPTLEKTAQEFETKYPQSDLRSLVWVRCMMLYYGGGNAGKTATIGHKVLALDPDNVQASIITAHAMTYVIRDSDVDMDVKLAEAKKLAENGIAGIKDKLPLPPDIAPAKAEQVRNMMRSIGLSTLGDIAYKSKDYATGEKDYLDSIKTDPEGVDEMTYFYLAASQDKLQKYSEAMKNIEKVIAAAPAGSALSAKANEEKTRLKQLMANPAPKP